MSNFNQNKKIKFLPLPYIGMFDLDLIYQTSDVELLYQILSKVNEIAQSQNIIIDNFEKVMDWAQNQIEIYTKEQLQEWLDDGTLSDIINDALNKIVIKKDITKLLPSFFVGNFSTDQIDNQFDYLLNKSQFNEGVLIIHLEYNEFNNLQILENISYIYEKYKNNINTVKFHMLKSEFNKKPNSVDEYFTFINNFLETYQFNRIVILNELATLILDNLEKISIYIANLKSKCSVSISLSQFEYQQYDCDDIISLVDFISINIYPSIMSASSNFPTIDRFIYSFNTQSELIQFLFKYNKNIVLSEIGCLPFTECLSSPGNSKLGFPTTPNPKAQYMYIKELLESNLMNNFIEVWTWYNEYTSTELQEVYKNYNRKVVKLK